MKKCIPAGIPAGMFFMKKAPRRGEKSLPREGKVAWRKPDRMRSKVAILNQLMVIVDRFDLISRNESCTSVVEV